MEDAEKDSAHNIFSSISLVILTNGVSYALGNKQSNRHPGDLLIRTAASRKILHYFYVVLP